MSRRRLKIGQRGSRSCITGSSRLSGSRSCSRLSREVASDELSLGCLLGCDGSGLGNLGFGGGSGLDVSGSLDRSGCSQRCFGCHNYRRSSSKSALS
jgi:hypothetical protein